MGPGMEPGSTALERHRGASLHHVHRDESGAIAIVVAVLFAALIGCAALAVDLGYLYAERAQAQVAADAGALAAASYLPDDMAGAQTAGREYVAQNLPNATAVVTPGFEGNPNNVEVKVRLQAPTFFARIFGIDSAGVGASAVAQYKASSYRKPLEVIVVQDASGSFTEEWAQAIQADLALLNLINGVSVEGDRTGFVAFSEGLKSTTYPGSNRSLGSPRKVNNVGDTDTRFGRVRALQMGLSDFNYTNQSALPAGIATMYTIIGKDNPGGYTYPESAINWAVDQFVNYGNEGTDKVIVFVSDGMPNPSSHRSPTNEAARRAGSAGIRLNTVTLTNEPTGGSYGTSGSDYGFNKDLVEKYNVGSDGQSLGGVALQTPDPARLRDLLVSIGQIELSSSTLVR
jgi:Flp pilus assembly protein TadG